MSIENRDVKFAKEIDDVMLLFPEIIRAIKSGKPVMEIAAGELANLVAAVQGATSIPEELKADRLTALQTIGYRTGELADAFL